MDIGLIYSLGLIIWVGKMGEIWNEKINKYTDWGGDSSTLNLPVSGFRVQEFIKELLENRTNSHVGEFNADMTTEEGWYDSIVLGRPEGSESDEKYFMYQSSNGGQICFSRRNSGKVYHRLGNGAAPNTDWHPWVPITHDDYSLLLSSSSALNSYYLNQTISVTNLPDTTASDFGLAEVYCGYWEVEKPNFHLCIPINNLEKGSIIKVRCFYRWGEGSINNDKYNSDAYIYLSNSQEEGHDISKLMSDFIKVKSLGSTGYPFSGENENLEWVRTKLFTSNSDYGCHTIKCNNPVNGTYYLHISGDFSVPKSWFVIDAVEVYSPNKAYIPLTYNGMGKVNLQKNLINGVNTLTLDMFYKGETGNRVPNTNTTYVIQYDYDLANETITVPENCILEFDGGSLSNGTIKGRGTLLQGVPSFSSVRLSGSFKNEVFHTDWCKDEYLDNYITDVLNISDISVVELDGDITLQASDQNVSHVYIKGNGYKITNSNYFNIGSGSVNVSDCTFEYNLTGEYNRYRILFSYRTIQTPTSNKICIKLNNIYIDGNNYLGEGVYYYRGKLPSDPTIAILNPIDLNIRNCSFKNITRYGIDLSTKVTGIISGSTFEHIGWEREEGDTNLYSAVAIRLGSDYVDGADNIMAKNVIIESNFIKDVIAPFNDQNDGREHHGILIYGNGCTIRDNHIENLRISFENNIDPGEDTEAIYVKGNYTIVSGNYIENGAGTHSDAAINLKHSSYKSNKIINNTIVYSSTFAGRAILASGDDVLIAYNHIIYGENITEVDSEHNDILYSNDCTIVKVYGNYVCWKPSTALCAFYYCNGADSLIVENNICVNIRRFVRTRAGVPCIIKNNTANIKDFNNTTAFIWVGSGYFENNTITLENCTLNGLMEKYSKFVKGNIFIIKSTYLETIIRGQDTQYSQYIYGNIFMFDTNSSIGSSGYVRRILYTGDSGIRNDNAVVLDNKVIGIITNPSRAGLTDCGYTSYRPINVNIGFCYYDTTLVKSIYWNNAWYDSAGTRVTWELVYTLTYIIASNPQQPNVDSSYTTTLTADEGYSLPADITVKIGSTTLTVDTDYTYDSTTGEVVVLGIGGAGGVTGALTIIASGVPVEESEE